MSLPKISLGDILELSGKTRAGEAELPVLSITMKNGLVDQGEKFKKRVASKDTSNYKVAYADELVVGFPIDEGVLGFQTKYPAGVVSPAYDVWKLKLPAKTHVPYLEKYLRSIEARQMYSAKMQGAVARRRSIKKSDFVKLEIPFPDKFTQIKISNLLEKVEHLIKSREDSINSLDILIKSLFVDIFGDPSSNYNDWDIVSIGDLVDEVKYGTSESAQGGKYKYLRMNNIDYNGYWNFSDIKHIDVEDDDLEKYSLRKGDLVFNRTNSKELVGKTAVYDIDEKVVIAGYLIRVRTNEYNNPWYIWGFLNSYVGKQKLSSLCRNIVGMANINANELKRIKIHKVPLQLQDRFEYLVKKIINIKEKYESDLALLESLYSSLSQKLFSGEVLLDNVDILEIDTLEENKLIKSIIKNKAYNDSIDKKVMVEDRIDSVSISSFLLKYKGEKLTASELWGKISGISDAPENFEEFRQWLFNSLKENDLKQVYHDFMGRDSQGQVIQSRKIALEIL